MRLQVRHALASLAAIVALSLGCVGCGFDEPVDAGSSELEDDDPEIGKLRAIGDKILANVECSRGPVTCPGAAWPSFEATDFQPKSDRNGTTYGLDVFKGKVVVVALLAAW